MAATFFWRLPPRDSNAQRRSRTGGFAYQAANHARWLATTFYPWPTQAASAHLKMFSLASDPSKPGAGETLLTGGTDTCPLQGRFPGPVLDATKAVVSRVRVIGMLSYTHVIVALQAAATLSAAARVLALALTLARHDTSRAPAGISPSSRYLHKAIKSLRATATIPTLRARLPW